MNLTVALDQAREHLRERRLEDAERICRSVLAVAPDNPESHFLVAAIAAQNGDLEAALGSLNSVLDVLPDHQDTRLRLAELLLALERYQEAADALSPLAAKDPRNGEILTLLAKARDRSGDWEGARQVWELQLLERRARAARHPLAGTGIRVLEPGYAVGRIGEMAMQLDLFAKMGALGWREPMIGVLRAPRIVNRCLLDYFRPHCQVVEDPDQIAEYDRLAEQGLTYSPVVLMLPDGRAVPEDRAMIAVNRRWQDEGRAPILSLTTRHAARGRARLTELGMPADAWFVCLHVRMPGYLREAETSAHRLRNADVSTYVAAIERIVERGGWVVRIGDRSVPRLPDMAQVIDFARGPDTSDWMDVYLMAAARFFLGTTSGPWTVATAFGVPVAMTNQWPFSERPFSDRDLFIPKLYRESGRPVRFAKAMSAPFRHNFWASTYDRLGVEVADNDAAEIADLTDEMLDRLDGSVAYDADDDCLQARFNQLAGTESYGVSGRLGRAFLRENQDLLP